MGPMGAARVSIHERGTRMIRSVIAPAPVAPVAAQESRGFSVAVTALAWVVAVAAIVNAYTYSVTGAIPIIQSDAWRFLDGFLGRFLEQGFQFADLFRQENAADTNLPLHKLFLFFHTRYFGMDFSLEGVFGVLSGIVFVLLLGRVAAGPVRQWGALEAWLIALLALSQLSLNSTNLYSWPLATMWFMPLAIAAMFIIYSARTNTGAVGPVVAGLLLGVLLDEVAYPIFVATAIALVVVRRSIVAADVRRVVAWSAVGIALSRLIYWYFNRGTPPVTGAPPLSAAAFFSSEAWKAAVIPLSDSVVHDGTLQMLFGTRSGTVGGLIALVLGFAHVAFWMLVFGRRRAEDAGGARLTVLAVAMMLVCYALVAGIVLQRVPAFGFDYLHQPRYVMFYQVQLAALVLVGYREVRHRPGWHRAGRVAFLALGLAYAFLQWKLSVIAWGQEKYVSSYLEGTARAMGRLAADPYATIECPDIMTVCQYPPAKRAELIGRLQRYRMNIFSPDFQAFHRLHPEAPAETSAADGRSQRAD